MNSTQLHNSNTQIPQNMFRGRGQALEPSALSGPRKVAILCLMLGDEAASEVLRYLGEEEAQRVFRELSTLQPVSAEVGNKVVKEFHDMFLSGEYAASAGFEFAHNVLVKSFGPETAKRMLDKVNRAQTTLSLDGLKTASPKQLAKLLENEHPQTTALVLAHLESMTAASVLEYLPREQRSDLIMRLAHLQTVSQDVIQRVLIAMDQKLKALGVTGAQVGGLRTAADLCNRLERNVAREALDEIQVSDPNLAFSIRGMMVTFDDLLLVDEIAIREILKGVDKSVIAMSLKGAPQEIQARFFSNMSAKAVEMMKEDMEYMGQVKMKDVSAAQREIVAVLTRLDEQGVISLSGNNGDDGYVI